MLGDEQNKLIDTDEARRIEAVLNEGWEKMTDNLYLGKL